MCRNRRGVYLAGISAAALEQVGNGLDAVIDARHESSAQAARPVRVPLWSLFGVAIAATLLTIWSLVHAMNWSGDISSAREWTLRSGVTSVSVAGWFAISVATWFYFLGFHRRARQWIHAADERIDAILSRLPYEDLEGVQIGAHFSAGPNLAEYGDEGFRTLRVSRELTTHCPECNGPVRSGAGACSKCGAILDWK